MNVNICYLLRRFSHMTIREDFGSPKISWSESVFVIFFCVVFVFALYLVPNVRCVSGLFILGCTFGFLLTFIFVPEHDKSVFFSHLSEILSLKNTGSVNYFYCIFQARPFLLFSIKFGDIMLCSEKHGVHRTLDFYIR